MISMAVITQSVVLSSHFFSNGKEENVDIAT